jgi:PST family polysaccharide transporter
MPKSTSKTILGNIISLYFLQGLNYVIPIAVLPYLVRVLGMEMYGLIAFAQSFAQYFTIFTDYGFNFSATRSIAQMQEDSEAISRFFSAVFALKLLLTGIGSLVLLLIVHFIPKFHQNAIFFYVAYIAVIGNVLFPLWYYQGIQQMRYISVITGITRAFAAVLLFFLVRGPKDALLSVGIQSGGILASGIIGIIIALIRFQIRLVFPSRKDIRAALVDGWHLFVSTAAISLYTNTNVFLVGILAGNVQAGYFSAAEKIVRAMNGLIGPVSQAIFPHVNTLVQESRDTALRFARNMLRYMLPCTLVPSLLLLGFTAPIAHLCFGSNGDGSIPVLRWIALLPSIIALSNVLGLQTMIPFGLDKQFSRILIFAGVFNVLFAIPLVKIFGATGAGASVFSTEILVSGAMIISLRQHGLSLFVRSKV